MKFIFYLACFFLGWIGVCLSAYGSGKTDSLEALLKKTGQDTTRLRLLNLLIESISDDDVWPHYNDAMGRLAKELGNSPDSSTRHTAKIYEAAYLNNVAVISFYKGDVPNAIRLHHESLRLREETGHLKGIAESLNNIGYAMQQQGELQQAILYYKRGLAIEEESGDSTGTALSLNNLGLTYYSQNRFREAIAYYEKSLALRTALDDKLSMATTLNNMGVSYERLQESDKAIACFERALALNQEIGNKRGMAQSLTELGNVYFNRGETDKALPLAIQAHALAEKTGYPVRIKATAQLLKKIYKRKGDFIQSLNMYELEMQMKDSMQNEETRKGTLQQQFRYEYEKREAAQQAEQEKKDAVMEQQLRLQRILKNASIAVVILLSLLVAAIVNRYQSRLRASKKLQDAYESLKAAQLQLVQKEKLASLGQLTASIAHEIKNPLNFVNNFSDLSRDLLEDYRNAKSESERELLLKELETNLSKISSHGRRADSIVRGMLLHSRSESGQKVATDIRELCESTFSLAHHGFRSRIPDFHCEIEKHFDSDLPLVSIIHQDISRVILNLLNNAFYAVHQRSEALKGNEAQMDSYSPKVSLSVHRKDPGIIITVRDNGPGIPPSVREKIFEPFFTTKTSGEGTGLGLSICYDILKAHNGDIVVHSRENEFTEFVIALPVA